MQKGGYSHGIWAFNSMLAVSSHYQSPVFVKIVDTQSCICLENVWTFPRCSHSLFEFRLPWGVLCSRSPLAEIQRGSLEWARCIEIPGINGTIEVGPCMREYSWTLDMESSMVSKVFQGWLNYHCQFSLGFGGCLLDVKYGLVGSCFMINHPSWRSIIHRILAFDYLSCGVVSPGPMNLYIMWWLGRGKFANASSIHQKKTCYYGW